MWECPKITRSAAGKRLRMRATRPARGPLSWIMPTAKPLELEVERLRGAPGGDVGPVVVAQHHPYGSETGQVVQHPGRADVPGVQDQVRAVQVTRDRRGQAFQKRGA